MAQAADLGHETSIGSSAPPPGVGGDNAAEPERLDHRRVRLRDALPILTIHALCLGILFTGWSWTAVTVAAALYFSRMFVITGFYHRYFSHRTFRTHRIVQFAFALFGTMAAQRGPLWWAAHHREHHRHSDHEPDPHSPWWRGVLWSHTGWFLTERGRATNWKAIPDWRKYPELVWLERHHLIGPLLLIATLAAAGLALHRWAPDLGADALQLVVWGFGVSTTLLYHGTFTVNSIAHTIGTQRFATGDDSRNNWFLALITLGEGWHNNHHHHPGSTRQGFYWWEIDPTYWILRVMARLGLVWDLRPVPARVYQQARHASRPRSRRRSSGAARHGHAADDRGAKPRATRGSA
jgi:stearoyl-CoA desaturase (Delta-9 desaturase)